MGTFNVLLGIFLKKKRPNKCLNVGTSDRPSVWPSDQSSVRAIVRPTDRPSVCPSRYFLLNYGRNSTKLATSLPHMVRVCNSNIIFLCVRPFVRRPSICFSRYLLLNHWMEFNQTCYITSFHGKSNIVFPSVRPSIYLLLNHWAKFNITSSLGKECESNIIFPCVCPSVCPLSVHPSVTLSPPKPLCGIQPTLLHHLHSW